MNDILLDFGRHDLEQALSPRVANQDAPILAQGVRMVCGLFVIECRCRHLVCTLKP